MRYGLQRAINSSLLQTRNLVNHNSPPPRDEILMNSESDWTVYRTRFVVRARQLTDSLIFTDALGRRQSGQPGDYLVEIFDGLLSITPRKFFEDIYVPLEGAADDAEARKSPAQDHRDCVPAPQPSDRQTLPRPRTVVHSRGSPLHPPRDLTVPRSQSGATLTA
jgi:hypothetical protein